MKSIIKFFCDIAESMGRAKAATHFSRMGRNDLARQIMLRD
jgi:hypothetical protein